MKINLFEKGIEESGAEIEIIFVKNIIFHEKQTVL